MKRIKFNTKQIKASKVVGNPYSLSERKHNEKYNIWMPENSLMTVEDGGPKTFTQFERELKFLHPNLYIVFNKIPASPDAPYGHAIRIRTNQYVEGFDLVAAVGKSGDTMIPAVSQITHFKDKITGENRSRVTSVGWSEAYRQVCLYLIRNSLAKKD